jgi:predicted O-methyltransferase YrrM
MNDWIDNITSAWTGQRKCAHWLVHNTKQDKIIVELGVDWGFSFFVFASALKETGFGKIYGIDLFEGDNHAGYRCTYKNVLENIKEHELDNFVDIIKGDFTDISKLWSKKIDILHIDGFHTFEAVKNDFDSWSPHVVDDGIILFHDTHIDGFQIKDFFRSLTGGYRLYFEHSAGLGIYTKNEALKNAILATFDNVHDFDVKPF